MTGRTMQPGSVEDVASAQAVVMSNLANGHKPDEALVKRAGIAEVMTSDMYEAPQYKANPLLKLFAPGTSREREGRARRARTAALEKPMAAALAAARQIEERDDYNRRGTEETIALMAEQSNLLSLAAAFEATVGQPSLPPKASLELQRGEGSNVLPLDVYVREHAEEVARTLGSIAASYVKTQIKS